MTTEEKAHLMRDRLRTVRNEMRAEGKLGLANDLNGMIQNGSDEVLAKLYDMCREASR